MSNLIQLKADAASIVEDTWTIVNLPASLAEERKQAGKVVLFKLTGENSVTQSKSLAQKSPLLVI